MSADIYDFEEKRRRLKKHPKAPPPWFRFFAREWLDSTRALSTFEVGVLISLIADMHMRGEPTPEDHARLGRLCGTITIHFRRALDGLLSEGLIVRRGGGLWSPILEKEAEFRRARNADKNALQETLMSGKNPIKSRAENDRDSESQSNIDSEVFEGPIKGPSSTSQSTSSESEDRGSRLDGAPPSRTFFVGMESVHPRLGAYTVTAVFPDIRKVRFRVHDSGKEHVGDVRPGDRFADDELDDEISDDCPF